MSAPKSIIVLPDRDLPDSQPEYAEQSEQVYMDPQVEQEIPNLTWQGLDDLGNAERFLAIYGADVRYVSGLKQWFLWDGRRWMLDVKHLVAEWARRAIKEFWFQALDTGDKEMKRFAQRSLDVPRQRQLLTTLQSKPEIAIEARELDRQPLLVNCRNCTLDLEMLEPSPHRREDLITRTVDVDYNPEAQCPLWTWFVGEALGDPEVVRAVQRAFAYSLSADTRAKTIFLCYGPPNAGKTTMLGIFYRLMGEYAALLLGQTLTTHFRGGDALADLADLRGARFVQVSEIGDDEQLAQKLLKGLVQGTGGQIKARRKYANMIQFPETWKIFMDMNHLPGLANPYDKGTLVRSYPIHFPKTAEKINTSLAEELWAEAPGILNWCAQVFPLFHREGLLRPARVDASLNEWCERSDHIPRFVEECCIKDPNSSVEPKALLESYHEWCGRRLEKPMAVQMLSQGLQHHGYQKDRTKKDGRLYHGLKLRKP